MSKNKRKGVSIILTIVVCLLILVIGAGATVYLGYKAYFDSDATFINIENIQNIDDSLSQTMANLILGEDYVTSVQEGVTYTAADTSSESSDETIEIVHITGEGYEGQLMIIKDPSLVSIAVSPSIISGSGTGLTLEELIEQEGAIGGTNAGGFEDSGGTGDGGEAWGIVIKDGELISGSLSDYTTVIGFNEDHYLICDQMTGQQALDWGIVEGITFGPVLVQDYEDAFTSGGQTQLNPRTVIGQRYDGAILLLVINGRQPSSFGCKYEDAVEIMIEYGARVAACLDGGNSSIMMYDGETVSSPVAIWGSRNLPTAIVVAEGE